MGFEKNKLSEFEFKLQETHMKRRGILQATAAGLSSGIPSWAFSQGIGSVKPGKPYAGTELNLLTVVAPQFKAHEAKLSQASECP
jgi:multiple sugar transport system substrate-binding protein